jgi:hypothetical protein
LFLFLAAVSWPCFADAPTPQSISPSESSVGTLAPTPEMWFYEQERARHDDVRQSIRRRAEQRGQERQARLASQKWYGISNSRPTVSPTPWFNGYSDRWGSNTYDPMRWRMPAVPLIVSRPGSERY